MSKLPLTEKYRPNTLDNVLSQDYNIKILKESLRNNQIQHMLFYGPAGTGKTSTILALSKEYYGTYYKDMILELNGSDDRGINTIRTQIKLFSRIKNLMHPDKPKIIILDEADSLTYDAQFALRRVMEQYTNNVRFCLICNYLNKLIPAIQSRCTLFKFSTIEYDKIYHKLQTIIIEEKLKIPKKSLDMIIELSNGDFRKSLNFIEQKNIDEYQYFLNINKKSYLQFEKLLLDPKTKNIEKTFKELIEINNINFSDLLKIISFISIKNKKYFFLSKLASVEYKYYLSENNCENLFIDFIILLLTKYQNF